MDNMNNKYGVWRRFIFNVMGYPSQTNYEKKNSITVPLVIYLDKNEVNIVFKYIFNTLILSNFMQEKSRADYHKNCRKNCITASTDALCIRKSNQLHFLLNVPRM